MFFFVLSTLVTVSSYASDCNVNLLGDLESENTELARNLLLKKGYQFLNSDGAKIVIEQFESGSGHRVVFIERFDSKGRKLGEGAAMGANDLGWLNPSWKRLVRRAIKKLPNCHE